MSTAGVGGFAHAPVTKLLCLACLGTSVAYQSMSGRTTALPLRLASILSFHSPGELVFGAMLLYYTRLFESVILALMSALKTTYSDGISLNESTQQKVDQASMSMQEKRLCDPLQCASTEWSNICSHASGSFEGHRPDVSILRSNGCYLLQLCPFPRRHPCCFPVRGTWANVHRQSLHSLGRTSAYLSFEGPRSAPCSLRNDSRGSAPRQCAWHSDAQ
eukprot:scaffold221165_cov39-Prasinocladus_malaysianus.AAC.1